MGVLLLFKILIIIIKPSKISINLEHNCKKQHTHRQKSCTYGYVQDKYNNFIDGQEIMDAIAYYPEHVRFPEPINLMVVELYLISIIMNIYKIDNPENVSLRNMAFIIPVVFKGFETILEISYTQEPYEQFNFKIGNELIAENPCLHIRIYYDNGVVGKLVFVRSQNVICPIPEANAGTWMVELTNSIICSLGINTSYLEDDALIKCNDTSAKYAFVRIFRGETPSWYEKFGYEINLNTARVQRRYPGYNKRQYDEDIVQLRNYPLSMILNGLGNLEKVYNMTPAPDNKSLLDDGIAAINAFNRHPTTETTLGDYMSRLWKDHCGDYHIINKFLRNSSRPSIDPNGNYFNWSPLYYRIEFTTYDYSRLAKC